MKLLLATVLVFTTLTATPTSASEAALDNCVVDVRVATERPGLVVDTVCYVGTGQQRAYAVCEYPKGTYTSIYGPWRYRGRVSTTFKSCLYAIWNPSLQQRLAP